MVNVDRCIRVSQVSGPKIGDNDKHTFLLIIRQFEVLYYLVQSSKDGLSLAWWKGSVVTNDYISVAVL